MSEPGTDPRNEPLLLRIPGSFGKVVIAEYSFEPTAGFVRADNESDDYVLTLPITTGRAEFRDASGAVVYNSVTSPGVVRVLAPAERSALRVHAAYRAVLVRIPAATCQAAANRLGRPARTDVFGGRPVLRPKEPVAALVPWFRDAARNSDPAERDLILPGLANALLLAMFRATAQAERSGAGFTNAQLDRLVAYADARLHEHVKLTEWSAVLGLSARDFAKRFGSHFGMTPYTWYIARRIERAMTYLSDTRLPLTDIAERTGFRSQSHFSAAFRRHVGMPPGRWRSTLTPAIRDDRCCNT